MFNNYWPYVSIVMVCGMLFIGSYQNYLEGARIKSRYGEKTIDTIAIICSFVFGVMVSLESWRGILSYIESSLAPGDDPVWAVILMPCGVVFSALVFCYVLITAATIARLTHKGFLHERIQESKRIRSIRPPK